MNLGFFVTKRNAVKPMYGVLGAAAMLCLLVACGQKGPLYLPESKNTTPEEQMESEKTDQVKEVVNTEDQGAL